MKILIIGGTGFISGSITKKLLERDYKVTLFNRGKTRSSLPEHKNLKVIHGDRDEPGTLAKISGSAHYDVVVDMIAYLPEHSKNAAEAFRNKTGRFIHCSTISVYMVSNQAEIPITEDKDKIPLMEYFPRNPFGMQYGIDKRKCEEELWTNHDPVSFPVTVIRPTFVSGPGDPAKRDYFWIQRILDERPLLVPGRGEYLFQQIYVEDCAEIFCRAMERDIAIGEAYNAAAEEIFTLNQYLKKIGELLNKEVKLCHIDQKEFEKLDISYSNKGDVFPFNPLRDTVFSLTKVKKHLDFSSTPFEQWMTETIEWFNNEYKKPSTGYEYRDEEIRIINSLMKWN